MKRYIFFFILVFVFIASFGHCQDTQKFLEQVSQGYTTNGILPVSSASALGGFSAAVLIAGILFGSIGFVAFLYGKRRDEFKTMIIGFLLMGFPYFVHNTWLLYGVGILLCVALYFFRE